MFAQVITLEKNKSKQKRLCKYISNNLGIPCYSFSGTLGKTTSLQQRTEYINPFFSQFGPPSAIGCAMSHIKVYEKFLRTDAKYCVICEDDIQFTKSAKDQFYNLKNDLDNHDHDIIYLGCFESPFLRSIDVFRNHLYLSSQLEALVVMQLCHPQARPYQMLCVLEKQN